MARQAVQATVVRGAELRAELAESALQPIRVVCLPSLALAPHLLVAARPSPVWPAPPLWLCPATRAADPHWNWDVWYGDLKPHKDHKFRHDYWYQVHILRV